MDIKYILFNLNVKLWFEGVGTCTVYHVLKDAMRAKYTKSKHRAFGNLNSDFVCVFEYSAKWVPEICVIMEYW